MQSPLLELHLGDLAPRVQAAQTQLRGERVIERIWARDHRVWQPDPSEISNRLAWLDSPERLGAQLEAFGRIRRDARADGLTHALLLGMGGSSLAPEMLARAFAPGPEGLSLGILDSTDPAAIAAAESGLDLERTLFLVASKSGGTVETLSLARYFHGRRAQRLGPDRAGRQFVAITDPGSKLESIAETFGFRAVVHGDPDIGGRFSALSPFGILPAALLDLDLETLLDRARGMARSARNDLPEMLPHGAGLESNPSVLLGLVLGALCQAGRDKLTLILPDAVAGLGDWIEQLVAESTGKQGLGILPVVGEAPWPVDRYGPDRVFVFVDLDRPDARLASLPNALAAAGHPLIRLRMRDASDLAAQLFLWEMATAVAAWRLAINPFDQPNVESAKRQARAIVEDFERSGSLAQPDPDFVDEAGHGVYGAPAGAVSAAEALWRFVSTERLEAGYLAVQAWLPYEPDTRASLDALRDAVTQATGMPVTVGFGPRFLHSTGQLHKGDAGRGIFLQLSAEPSDHLPIPDDFGSQASRLDFGLLERAQALGDAAALRSSGRQVIEIRLAGDPAVAIRRLATWRAG